jgi:NAD(P)-dependent dehydrogenase (short-subunit alcohol dehydrogenase family)
MRLEGKRIIVTGSTTGIGEAIARRCVKEGAKVVLHGRDQKRGDAIREELGEAVSLHVDDLADPKAPDRLVAHALDTLGGLDGLVNNVGWPTRGTFYETDSDRFDEIIAVNLKAPFLMIRSAIEALKESKGSIVNIGSVNGFCGENTLFAYSMAKGGLMTMSRNLAEAFGRDGVTVTHLNVGWVLTPNEYQNQLDNGQPEDWHLNIPPEFAPSGRLIDPSEIAANVVFWLSGESGPVTGSVIELEQFPMIGRNPAKSD